MCNNNRENFIFGQSRDEAEDFRVGRFDDEESIEAINGFQGQDSFDRFRFRCNDLRCFNRCRERAIESCYNRCCRRSHY